MVEIAEQFEANMPTNTELDADIVELQDIISESTQSITYQEARAFGESLLEFFKAFSEEGIKDDSTT